MKFMVLGLLLWCGLHFVPTLAQNTRQVLMTKLGENGYKGIYSLLILCSIGLIVYGWRHSLPVHLYTSPPVLWSLAWAGILVAFILMGATGYPSIIKRFIRHPQLTGVMVWALAHLLVNGDSRSCLLFGTMAAWAGLEIILINRRDGAYTKPASPPLKVEIKGLAISLLVFVVVVFAHPYLSGVPLR